MRRVSRTIDSLSRPPALRGVAERKIRHSLSQLSIDLLRIAEAQGDPSLWRARILALTQRYPVPVIRVRLKELAESGLLTTHGTTRTGWLTPKGRRHLDEAG